MSKKVESGTTTNYTYDGSNRLLKESAVRNGVTTNMTYAYDTAGNRSKLTVTGSKNCVTSYTYDKNNRLLRESKVNNGSSYADLTIYSYDNNGNQIRKDQSKNNLNDKPTTGFYSENEIGNTGYGYERFTYNGLNQLVKFEDEQNNTTDYTYWSDGLRLSKSVNGNLTNFIWDGSQTIMTVTSDETVSYAKAPGYMRRGTSKEFNAEMNDNMYLFNAHGDVTAMTDKNTAVIKTYEYDAFGNELNPSATDTNPFRYCGEYYDDETGSIYLRARYYSPTTGRFTAEDPIKDGLNWYAYCGDNPVAFVDPFGLQTKTEIDNSMSEDDKNALKGYQSQYKTCETVNDYKGMFKAYKGATELRKKYDPDYRDTQFNGFVLYIGEYSTEDGTTGDIYMITSEKNTNRIYENINEFIDDDDYICSDLRYYNPFFEEGKNNPTIKVFDSYRADEEVMYAVCFKIELYETDHPSEWKRSVNSMVREWKAHNLAYIVPTTRDSTKDVDFDLNSENTAFLYNHQYKK